MSFLFRSRRSDDEHGSGGKILRGRRATPSASPYLRPENSLTSSLETENPRWLSGIISGAGKLLSTVFRSDSDSSSSYSSDDDISSDEDDQTNVSSKDVGELNQSGGKPKSSKDHMEGSLAIAKKSESKLVIEQLLMQETFSRDECNKLTKIIQSRVVDFPFYESVENVIQEEFPDRTIGSSIAFPRAWRSLSQARKLPEAIPYSAGSLNTFSPGSCALQACTPDLRNTAVKEAKKWLEEKKLASNSKSDLDCGPCTLNTDMLQHGIEGEVGSPVDMAKSYMQSLPPWQSPSFSSIGFKTPPSSGMHLFKDEISCAIANHSLPSSKVPKRNYHATGIPDTLDETRRVRMKTTENILGTPNFKQIDSSARMLECEASIISSAAFRRGLEVRGTYSDSSNLPAAGSLVALPAAMSVEDHDSDGSLRLPDEKAVEVNHPMKTGDLTSTNTVSEPEETVNALQLMHERSTTATLPLEPAYSDLGSEPKASNADALILDEYQDVEEPLQTKEQVGSTSVPHDSLFLASKSVEHVGGHSEDVLDSEENILPSEDTKSGVPSADEATILNDVHTLGEIQANNSSQPNLVSDSRSQDGNDQIQKEATGLTSGVTANGSSAGLDTIPYLGSVSKGDPNSSNGESVAGISAETGELLSKATIEVPVVHGNNSITDRSQNGKTMKSIERILSEDQPKTIRGRGKKAVAKPRRGRGRGK